MVLTARWRVVGALLAVTTALWAARPGAATSDQAAAAATGTIRGRLDIRRLASVPQPRPDVGEFGGRAPRAVPDVRRGLVYLDVAPRSAFDDGEPGRAVMDQRNETFVPRLLAVQTGTTVDFPNSDATFHNVFSLSRARRFDLGRYAAGKSKAVRFDRPGVVRVFCDIHSHMSAFVVVFNHPFFRVTDADGRFRIDNVPPGTYTVVGWYEGEARTQRPVTVTAGAISDFELVVP
jgi:plastocyanin